MVPYLNDHIFCISDDLRLIIKAKEESNISLEKELEDLTVEYKLCQDDSRRRETELLQDLDMLHDKNEVRMTVLIQLYTRI